MNFWRRGFRQRRRASTNREQDADRELQAHLELEAEEFRQSGLGHEAAAGAAQRALGNTTLIREEIRAVWAWTILEQLAQDCRYAFRTLIKNPGFSVVALLSLALGIGANTAIFTFVNAAFLKPLPYPDADRIVALQQRPLKGAGTYLRPSAQFRSVAGSREVFRGVGHSADGAREYGRRRRRRTGSGLWVSPDFFRVFSVQPFIGRGFSPDGGFSRSEVREGRAPGQGELILSYGYWQRRFGADAAIVGKSDSCRQGLRGRHRSDARWISRGQPECRYL